MFDIIIATMPVSVSAFQSSKNVRRRSFLGSFFGCDIFSNIYYNFFILLLFILSLLGDRFYFLLASLEVTSVWGVSTVAILDSSVNCVCVWSTKKLTMLAYCVAANCNNSQMTPGITMHELLRNQPAVRRKWIKFIQFKQADFLAAPHHAHLCSEHFSECDFANPMEYRTLKLT